MPQKGIIVLAINNHHLPIVIFELHPVAYLFEVFISQAILNAEGIQSISHLLSPCSGMAQNLLYQAKIIVIQLDPLIHIAFHLLSVEEPLVPGKSMIRQLILPAEVANF